MFVSAFIALYIISMKLCAFQIVRFPYTKHFLRAFSKEKLNVDNYDKKVLKCLQQLKLSPSSTFLLSVSGGSDSMAMLHVFKTIQDSFWKDMQLKIVHFNHKMREESDEEVTNISLFLSG
jgi:tRNA(Ile)-lysidine synthase TilS/MesJ